MAIRKQIQWNHNKKSFTGLIDLGNKLTDTKNKEPATNALLYLVNGYWKISVVYFFVNSLTGKDKHLYCLIVLKAVEDTGAEVVVVTFDGPRSNIAMVNALGGQIRSASNIKPYFPHPITKKPIYLLLDVCHMLKVVRNTLGIQYIYKLMLSIIS